MTEDRAIYTYTPEDGVRLPGGIPARDLTERDIERLTPDQRREIKHLAQFTAVNKGTATRTINRVRAEEVEQAVEAAESEAN